MSVTPDTILRVLDERETNRQSRRRAWAMVSVSKEHSMQVALTLTPKNLSGSYIATPFVASYIIDNKEMKATAEDLF